MMNHWTHGFESRDRKGAIMVLVAVMLGVLFMFAAFTIDIGHIIVAQSELQNAADAAALSAVGHLQEGPAQARAAAIALAACNQAANQSVSITDADIELGTWNEETATFTVLAAAHESSANAVRVTCARTAARESSLRLFFAPMFGRDTADIQVTATAHTKPASCGLFIGIDKVTISGGSFTDSYHSDDGPYNAASAGNQGHVCSDGPITLSGPSYIDGNAFPGENDSVSTSGSSYVTGSRDPRTELLNLPPVDFGDSASNNNNALIPASDDSQEPYDAGNGKFGLSGGDHVTLAPGTYHFSEFVLSGGSSITLTGPTTIYCVGKFTASGSSIVNSTALPTNLQVFCTGDKVDISGGSHFYGVVYAPTSKVVRSSGSGHVFGSLIGKELTLSGGGGAHADMALGALDGTSVKVKLVD